jgi:hypothetical protein
MATYGSASPWFTTPVVQDYLDILEIRPIAADPDDDRWTITTPFHNRPDLASFALYGTPKLWWVFAQRNMDKIKDPIFDFVPGVEIYLPKKNTLFDTLGL